MTISKETQELIISALMKNASLFSVVKDEITDGYFSDGACKVIFKALTIYYKKYNTLPNLPELFIAIEECWNISVGVLLDDVKATSQKLFAYPESDENFIRDKIIEFIRKVRSTNILTNLFEDLTKEENPTFESEQIVSKLSRALEVNLSSNTVFRMNDLEQVKKARLDSVGSEDQSKIIKTNLPTLNNSLMFGGWQPNTINMVCGPPGTGKSMFLINEGVCAAKQGFNVLHIFIGDMVEYDGYIRYLSCISGTPQNTLVMMTPEQQHEIVNFCNQQYNNIFDKLTVVAYPSQEITVNTLVEDISKFEKQLGIDFDMIIIDYPDNLKQEGKSLYEDGGVLYSCLERLARITSAVLLVASQVNKIYWQYEILPLEAAAESSKKQQCVDIVLGMNTTNRQSVVGSFHLAKARKGKVGTLWRFKTDYAICKISEVDEATYNAYKDTVK